MPSLMRRSITRRSCAARGAEKGAKTQIIDFRDEPRTRASNIDFVPRKIINKVFTRREGERRRDLFSRATRPFA